MEYVARSAVKYCQSYSCDSPVCTNFVALNFLEEFWGSGYTIANLDIVEKRLILRRDCGVAGDPAYYKFSCAHALNCVTSFSRCVSSVLTELLLRPHQ
jgi:hypothetical protein